MKAHLLDLKNRLVIASFLSMFNLECDTNRILEGSAMSVFPYYTCVALANVLNSHMCAHNRTAPFFCFSAQQLCEMKSNF